MHRHIAIAASRTLSDTVPVSDTVGQVVRSVHSTSYHGQMLPQMLPFPFDPFDALGMFAGFFVFGALVVLFYAVVGWRIFAKAGKPGLAILVPVHNVVVSLEIAGRPLWWIFLTFIPLLNFLVLIVLAFDFAKRFGKGRLFGLGIVFLWFLFLPILAFGCAKYRPSPA